MKPEKVVEVFRQYLINNCKVAPHDTGIIGVSGGADSTLLLFLLATLKDELDLELIVVAVDHGLRQGSREEVEHVRALARHVGLEFRFETVDVRRRGREEKLSLEEAARLERRAVFERVAAEHEATWIALGHTASDQAETVMLRLRRGTGLDGLSCMAATTGKYIRPILWLERETVREHLARLKVEWCEDPMNSDRRFERSRLRFEVMPAVSDEKAMSVADAARRLTASLRRGEDAWYELNCRSCRDGVLIEDPDLAQKETPVIARLVRRAARAHWTERMPLTRAETIAIVDLSRGRKGEERHLHGASAQLRSKAPMSLHIGDHHIAPEHAVLEVTGPGTFRSEALGLTVVAGSETPRSPIWGRIEEGTPFQVRHRLPGDRLGLNKRKLKRFWDEHGVARYLRNWVPLVVRDNMVIWTGLSPSRGDRDERDERDARTERDERTERTERTERKMLVSLLLDRTHPLRLWLG